MAASGSYYKYPATNFGLYVEWSATQNVTGNYSTVTQKIYLSYYTLAVGKTTDATSSINGTTVTYSTPAISDFTDGIKKKLLYTHTVEVKHDNNGTKKDVALSASWKFNGVYAGVSIGTITASTTVDLNEIDRAAPTVAHSTSNITANGFKLSATASVTADIWEYSVNGGQSYTQFSTTAGTTANVTLSNLSPNTTYSVRVRARKKSNQVYGYSTAANTKTLGGSVLTSAARKEIDVDAPTLEFCVTVYESSYYHRLNVKNGSETVFSVNLGQYTAGTSMEKSYTLTSEQRTLMLNQIPNLPAFTATLELVTYSDKEYSIQIGNSSQKQATMSTSAETSKPVFTSFAYCDTREQTVAATENDQVLLQAYSMLQIIADAGTAMNGASIASYSVEIGDVSKSFNCTTMDVGAIGTTGNLTLKVTCFDSRGYSASVSKKITVLAYAKPKLNSYTLRRKDEIEDIIQLEFSGSFTAIKADGTNDTNSMKFIGFYYKRTDQDEWSDWVSLLNKANISGNTFSFATDQLMINETTALSLDPEYSWHFHILIRDELDTLASCDLFLVIPQGSPIISLRKRNTAYDYPRVGINNPKPQEALDVLGNIAMNGTIVLGFVGDIGEYNFNSFTKGGVYWYSASVDTSNAPVKSDGMLEVITNGSSVIQRFTSVDNGCAIYIRSYIAESKKWTAWGIK